MFIIDELSGDCAFGLCALLRRKAEVIEGFLVSYGTAPQDTAMRNAREFFELVPESAIELFAGASAPLATPAFMDPIPHFYGLDGKLGIDFRALAGAAGRSRPSEVHVVDFFDLLGDRAKSCPVVLCVLGPWTDVASRLRREREGTVAPSLDQVSAVVTVAGAFVLDAAGKSIGNEGTESQAEYNAYLDPQSLIEGLQFFNAKDIPVYDISWAFIGRWRVWRGLLEALAPDNTKDALAWTALLLSHNFYVFHGGNIVSGGAGVGERAWFTADAHALLFAAALTEELRTGKGPPCETLQCAWSEAQFTMAPTDFVVVYDDRDPGQYGRTVRLKDREHLPSSISGVSDPVRVFDVSLAANEEKVLARMFEAMGIRIDLDVWNRELARHQQPTNDKENL